MSLQHIVLFSFPRDLSEGEYAEMRAQVASWPAAIGGMTRLRFGSDLSGARTRGYSRLLCMEFDSTDELKRYQQHPVHRSFQDWLAQRQCTPLAFDYFIDGDTVLIDETDHGAEERR
jgi:Stress responsive A/B Barrel Domain